MSQTSRKCTRTYSTLAPAPDAVCANVSRKPRLIAQYWLLEEVESPFAKPHAGMVHQIGGNNRRGAARDRPGHGLAGECSQEDIARFHAFSPEDDGIVGDDQATANHEIERGEEASGVTASLF